MDNTLTLRRALVAGGVGVGLALGAAGIAGAASTPPSPKPGTTAKVVPGPGEPHRGGHHRGGPGMGHGMGLRGALHGELVVPKGTGFQTVDVQRGEVTAVSATSLTVKSADGFTKSYVLTPRTIVEAGRDGITTVKVGEKVGVLATVAGNVATATHVRDLTQLKAARKEARPPRPDGVPGPAGGAPGAAPSDYDESGLEGA